MKKGKLLSNTLLSPPLSPETLVPCWVVCHERQTNETTKNKYLLSNLPSLLRNASVGGSVQGIPSVHIFFFFILSDTTHSYKESLTTTYFFFFFIHATQDIVTLWDSISRTSLVSLRNLINNLNHSPTSPSDPAVSCIVSHVLVSAALDAAEEFGIPGVALWTMSPFVFLSYLHYQDILEKVLIPYKDEGTEKLNILINFIPGMREIRLKDLPSFLWDGNDAMNNLALWEIQRVSKASVIVINTFDALESMVLDALKSRLPTLPPIYAIGPLQLLEQQIPNQQLKDFRSNLWEEHQECMKWLDSQQPNSVVYVNFGSITVMSLHQFTEFAWGLANSKCPFLWVIRPDLVTDDEASLPQEFIKETADWAMI